MQDLASAVEYLHANSIVHCDICSKAVLVTPDLRFKLFLSPLARSSLQQNKFEGAQGQPVSQPRTMWGGGGMKGRMIHSSHSHTHSLVLTLVLIHAHPHPITRSSPPPIPLPLPLHLYRLQGYQAPESYHGKGWNLLVDVYGLGVVFFEIAHQRWAYGGSDGSEGAHVVPGTAPTPPAQPMTPAGASDAIAALVADMMNDDPTDRPVVRRVVGTIREHMSKAKQSE